MRLDKFQGKRTGLNYIWKYLHQLYHIYFTTAYEPIGQLWTEVSIPGSLISTINCSFLKNQEPEI